MEVRDLMYLLSKCDPKATVWFSAFRDGEEIAVTYGDDEGEFDFDSVFEVKHTCGQFGIEHTDCHIVLPSMIEEAFKEGKEEASDENI